MRVLSSTPHLRPTPVGEHVTMSRVWRFAIPVAVLVAVGGYAASSLAASDLDVTPRKTIVIDDDTDRQQPADGRERPGTKGDDRGDDGRKTDDADDGDDVDVVEPDVDDLDDLDDDADPAERTDDRGDDG
jgi:hypothetical protein